MKEGMEGKTKSDKLWRDVDPKTKSKIIKKGLPCLLRVPIGVLLVLWFLSFLYELLQEPVLAVFCTPETCEMRRQMSPSEDGQTNITLFANHLHSGRRLVPYGYNQFGFCQAAVEQHPSESFIQALFEGQEAVSTPYTFAFGHNASCVKVCTKHYPYERDGGNHELESLKQAVRMNYLQYWTLADLPVSWCYDIQGGSKFCNPGFPVGCYVDKDGNRHDACVIDPHFDLPDHFYVFNHVDITIKYYPLYGRAGINAIESITMKPQSIKHNKEGKCGRDVESYEPMAIIGEGVSKHYGWYELQEEREEEEEDITFTYSVTFVPYRSNEDSKMQDHANIMWFSAMNSLVIILFLTGVLAVIVLRNRRKEFSRSPRHILQDPEWRTPQNDGQTGIAWRHAGLFQQPGCRMLLSVLVSTGTHMIWLLALAFAMVSLATVRPQSESFLRKSFAVHCLIWQFSFGSESARWYKLFGGKRWKANALLTVGLIPGFMALIGMGLNYLLWSERSPMAITPTSLLAGIGLWFSLSTPFVFLGYCDGLVSPVPKRAKIPVRSNESPERIQRSCFNHWLTGLVLGGLLPFGTIFIQLFFLLNTLVYHTSYSHSLLNYRVMTLFLMIITCYECTIILCYKHLHSRTAWWWHAFLTGGSVAIYFFFYCVHYFFTKLEVQGVVDTLLFFGWVFMATVVLFIICGAWGFIACFTFMTRMYRSAKTVAKSGKVITKSPDHLRDVSAIKFTDPSSLKNSLL